MIRKIILLIFLILASSVCFATNIYFATSGNDITGNGTIATPYATIAKLNTLIGTLTPGDSALFKRGDTFTGTVTPPPNGSPGNAVVIGPYGTGARPILTGLATMSGWSNLGSNIWEISCNSGATLDLVMIGGTITAQGRTPDVGSYYNVDSHTDLDGSLIGTITSSSFSGQNWVGAEVVVRSSAYTLDRNRVTIHSGTAITYKSRSLHNAENNAKLFIQGHVGTLTAQNEWYYNPVAHTLRMYSTTNPDALSVSAAIYDYGVNDNTSSDVNFYGLKFIGYDSIALNLLHATRTLISYCDFDAIGSDAIVDSFGVRFWAYNNNFTRIANTAFAVRRAEYTRFMYNTIDGCGLIKGMNLSFNQQMDGVMVENEGDSLMVMYNSIQNVGYCGIRFMGTNAQIMFNYINNYGLTVSDGGGIYTNGEYGLSNQRVIAYNIVRNGYGNHDMSATTTPGGVPPIYIDDNGGNVDIYHNTCEGGSRYGIFLHNARDINIAYNRLYNSAELAAIGMIHDGGGNVIRYVNIHHNYIYNTGTSRMFYLSTNAADITSFGTFDNNYFSRSTTTNLFLVNDGGVDTHYTFASWKSTFTGWDAASAFTTVIDDSMRLVYNVTAGAQGQSLGASYRDLIGTNYASNITLDGYAGEILRKITTIAGTAVDFVVPYYRGRERRTIIIN